MQECLGRVIGKRNYVLSVPFFQALLWCVFDLAFTVLASDTSYYQ